MTCTKPTHYSFIREFLGDRPDRAVVIVVEAGPHDDEAQAYEDAQARAIAAGETYHAALLDGDRFEDATYQVISLMGDVSALVDAGTADVIHVTGEGR